MLEIFKALIILGKQILERLKDHFHQRPEISNQNRVVLLLINRVSQYVLLANRHNHSTGAVSAPFLLSGGAITQLMIPACLRLILG